MFTLILFTIGDVPRAQGPGNKYLGFIEQILLFYSYLSTPMHRLNIPRPSLHIATAAALHGVINAKVRSDVHIHVISSTESASI